MAGVRSILKLACIVGTLVLSGCAQEVERKLAAGSDQGRPAKLFYRPQVEPAAAPVPPTDALHFDLECDLHGRVIADAHPEMFRGTYPANETSWRYDPHMIVDLQSMRTCEFNTCAEYGPHPIVRVTPDLIVFDDRPGITESVRRRDGRYAQRMEDIGEVSVTRGRCFKTRFSGFPAAAARSGT
jgi:hypothetical protein